jgi:hypothetical protein
VWRRVAKMRRIVCACLTAAVAGTLLYLPPGYTAALSAQNGTSAFPDPNACEPAVCGRTSPLIPMQSTEAVHMGLVWKRGSNVPKLLYHCPVPGIHAQ